MITSVLIAVLIILLVLSALLSASETALFSLSSFTLKAYNVDKDNRKKLIAHLLKKPRELLVTILMLNIIANILVQNTVSSLFGSFSGWLVKVGVPLLLTLFLGELIPKSIALPNNKAVSYFISPFIAFCARVLGPLRTLFTKMTNYISRFLFFFMKKEKPLSSAELEHVLSKSKEKGIINIDENQLARGYLKLHDTSVKEHMRPRNDVLFYDINKDISKLLYLFTEKQTSRIPVCDENLENIIGIMSVKRFFFYRAHINSQEELKEYLKKPFFIPESTKSWTVLKTLRDKRESIAIVVDEYGSISGLVTQEDLVEAVIGEVVDKRDVKQQYTYAGSDVIIASGKLELDEIEKIFNIKLKRKTNSVTLGGWLTDLKGDIPQAGAKFKSDNLLFYILAADPNRVRRVYIRLLKPSKRSKKHNE